jgi:hypothetical protein
MLKVSCTCYLLNGSEDIFMRPKRRGEIFRLQLQLRLKSLLKDLTTFTLTEYSTRKNSINGTLCTIILDGFS